MSTNATVTCAVCGRTPDTAGDPPLTWSRAVTGSGESRRVRWTCDVCARRHVRSIEAKLDEEWW